MKSPAGRRHSPAPGTGSKRKEAAGLLTWNRTPPLTHPARRPGASSGEGDHAADVGGPEGADRTAGAAGRGARPDKGPRPPGLVTVPSPSDIGEASQEAHGTVKLSTFHEAGFVDPPLSRTRTSV